MSSQRIKIGNYAIDLRWVISAQVLSTGTVWIEMFPNPIMGGESGSIFIEEPKAQQFWEYYLRSSKILKVGPVAVNRNHISSMEWNDSEGKVSILLGQGELIVMKGEEAREIWEAFSVHCSSLDNYQPPRAKPVILDQFCELSGSK